MPRYCSVCKQELSLEVGIVTSTTLAEGAPFTLYCEPCDPNQGRGYTLSDLQKMREDNQVGRARYQMAKLEQLGADVYFHVTGPSFPPEDND